MSEAQIGKKLWPLKVDHGVLKCEGSNGVGVATFTAPNGKEYALNGAARSTRPEINPIWAGNPDVPGAKKNIGPLVELALKLCK